MWTPLVFSSDEAILLVQYPDGYAVLSSIIMLARVCRLVTDIVK